MAKAVCGSKRRGICPVTAAERRSIETTLACFDRARALDPTLLLPEDELTELRRFFDGSAAPGVPPAPQGIGFRRGTKRWSLTGRWTVRLPGYYYENLEGDDTVVLTFGDRRFQATSWRWKPNAAEYANPDDCLAALFGIAASAPLIFDADHLRGAIDAPVWVDDDDTTEPYWALKVFVAGADTGLAAVICYRDPRDESWARSVAKTLNAPPDD